MGHFCPDEEYVLWSENVLCLPFEKMAYIHVCEKKQRKFLAGTAYKQKLMHLFSESLTDSCCHSLNG